MTTKASVMIQPSLTEVKINSSTYPVTGIFAILVDKDGNDVTNATEIPLFDTKLKVLVLTSDEFQLYYNCEVKTIYRKLDQRTFGITNFVLKAIKPFQVFVSLYVWIGELFDNTVSKFEFKKEVDSHNESFEGVSIKDYFDEDFKISSLFDTMTPIGNV